MTYIIYCRKSTDESSGKQAQSISDQMRSCLMFVDGLKGKIEVQKRPPEYYDLFGEEAELKRVLEKDIYKRTKNLFVIAEQRSAKIPGRRDRRTNIIKRIKKGKIKGIISYEPNRQARNLLEAGELMDLVDQDKVSLKYSNFHFEPNANGKMMLGIRFVVAKQFSDNQSEVVNRGKKSVISKGKSDGKFKHGYTINDSGYHEPHSKYFALRKEAFKMKLYENKSDEVIGKRLKKEGYKREYKTGKRVNLNIKSIYKIWKDPFFYGKFICGKHEVDLNDKNPFFEPMITEEEYGILIRRHYEQGGGINPSTIKEENETIMPFSRGMIITSEGYALTHNLPNKNRRIMPKLYKLLNNKPNATLANIVKPHQIKYTDANKDSLTKGLTVTAEQLINFVIDYLKGFKVSEEEWNQYAKTMRKKLKKTEEQKTESRKILQLEYNNISSQKYQFSSINMERVRNIEEEKIYQDRLQEYDEMLISINKKKEALAASERDTILEIDSFMGVLQNAPKYFEKATYVQKRKICDLLFSNIIISAENTIEIKPKPGLEHLFTSSTQEKFRPGTNLKAWCFTIMKNLFINEYRKKIKRNTILDSTDNTFLLDSNVVNNRSDGSLLFKELKFLVETLDENLKIPFIKHFEGHKYQEIADELELPLGTIKSRIFFARKELRSSIKEIYGVDSSCYTLLLD